jgi:hypothetical protein
MTQIDPPRPARLALDGFAGRRALRVEIVGELPKRWRVRFLEDGPLPRDGYARVGAVALVPKHDVLIDARV